MAKRRRKSSSRGAKRRVSSAARGRTAAQERNRIRLEIASIAVIAVGVFLIFSQFTGSAGRIGTVLHDWFLGLFGHMAMTLPFFVVAYGGFMLLGAVQDARHWRVSLVAVIFLLMCITLSGRYVELIGDEAFIKGADSVSGVYALGVEGAGNGVVGSFIAKWIIGQVGIAGHYILCLALLIVAGILLAGMPMSKAAGRVRDKRAYLREERQQRLEEKRAILAARQESEALMRANASSGAEEKRPGLFRVPSFLGGGAAGETEKDNKQNILDAVKNDEVYGDLSKPRGLEIEDTNVPFVPDKPDAGHEPDSAASLKSKAGAGKKTPSPMHYGSSQDDSNYKLPPIDLLSKGKSKVKTQSESELKANAAKLERALRDFKVEAHVEKVTVGPTVTRYEVEPDIGVKIQSIRSLEPDLALKLEVKSVRVVPMPGQSVVGIEAYNANTSIVTLREMIDSDEFRESEGKINFALGKNISGKRIIVDLREMPHLLIAGTTNSGKSVCINSILLSILYRAKPSEVKLILIDPKVVELKLYNDLPHLLVPVVTDPERAAMALSYAVTIMNDRYKKFAEHNVRNLDNYNDKMKKAGQYEEVMPEIVIVIDELNDLMMVASAKVQESISRLAQMARAAGMHLIVATQQPLASVLTSIIKSNIPSRIAFAVSSNSHSRVILDSPGAEKLLGKGDMLFHPLGSRESIRVQGSLAEENEVLKVVNYVKKQMDPDYNIEVMTGVDAAVAGSIAGDEDEFFFDAVEMVANSDKKQVSVSMLQRHFRIGYNRAARLVDMMEERGIVAASDGTNKPRRLIMNEAQLKSFLKSAGQASWLDEESPADIPEDEYIDEYEDDIVDDIEDEDDFDDSDDISGEEEAEDTDETDDW